MNVACNDLVSERLSITWLLTSLLLISFAVFKMLLNILLAIYELIKIIPVPKPLILKPLIQNDQYDYLNHNEQKCPQLQRGEPLPTMADKNKISLPPDEIENLPECVSSLTLQPHEDFISSNPVLELPSNGNFITLDPVLRLPSKEENITSDPVLELPSNEANITLDPLLELPTKEANITSDPVLELLSKTLESYSESLPSKVERNSETEICAILSNSNSGNLALNTENETFGTDAFLSSSSNSDNLLLKAEGEVFQTDKCGSLTESILEIIDLKHSDSETDQCEILPKNNFKILSHEMDRTFSEFDGSALAVTDSSSKSLPLKTERQSSDINICGFSCSQRNPNLLCASNNANISTLNSEYAFPPSSVLKGSLINQKGFLCTILNGGNKYIYSLIDNAPFLITIGTLRKPLLSVDDNVGKDIASNTICFNFVWSCEKIMSLHLFGSGYEVMFDAMLIPGTKKYQALLVWNGFKPSHIPLPFINSYSFINSFTNVPAWLIFSDLEFLYIDISVENSVQKTVYSIKKFCKENFGTTIKGLQGLPYGLGTPFIADISKFCKFEMNPSAYIFVCESLCSVTKLKQRIIKPSVYSNGKVYDYINGCTVESNLCSLYSDVDLFLEDVDDYIVIKTHVSHLYIELEAKLERSMSTIGQPVPYFKGIKFAKGSILKTLSVNGETNWSILMMNSELEEWVNDIRGLQLSESSTEQSNLSSLQHFSESDIGKLNHSSISCLSESNIDHLNSSSNNNLSESDIQQIYRQLSPEPDLQNSQKSKKKKKKRKKRDKPVEASEISSCDGKCIELENLSKDDALEYESLEKSKSECSTKIKKGRNVVVNALQLKLNEQLKSSKREETGDEKCAVAYEQDKNCISNGDEALCPSSTSAILSNTINSDIHHHTYFCDDSHEEIIEVPLPKAPTTDRTNSSTKSYLTGKIKSVDEDSLNIGNYVVSRDKCFFFGVSIYTIDLKTILCVGQKVEYEYENESKCSIKQCWIGSPCGSPEECYENIYKWCRQKKVSTEILCYLLEKTGWVPDNAAPIPAKSEHAQIVHIS